MEISPSLGVPHGGAAAPDPRVMQVAFALHLAAEDTAMAAIAAARRTGQPWQVTSADRTLTAALTPDGFNLLVRGAGPPVRVRLPDAQPVATGRAMLGAGNGPDALTRFLFDGPVTINPASTAAQLRNEVFTEAQVIQLAGAFAGSTLRIMRGLGDSAVSLYVTHPSLILQQNRVVLRSNQDGLKTVKLEEFFLANDAPAGTGLRAFARMAQAAQAAGFVSIETVAVGTALTDRNGYYTWPRFGFNAVLQPSLAQQAGTSDLLTLMATPEGRSWWLTHGGAVSAQFDLLPGSRSLAALASYMREKDATV